MEPNREPQLIKQLSTTNFPPKTQKISNGGKREAPPHSVRTGPGAQETLSKAKITHLTITNVKSIQTEKVQTKTRRTS